MSTETPTECQQADALLNDALSESPAGGEHAPTSREQRLLRATEYQAEALSKKSNRDACLGSITAGLVRMATYLEEAIENALTAEPVTIERIRQIAPALNDHLRLTRQIDRFAQFDLRVEEKCETAKNARGKVEMFARQAFPKDAGIQGVPRVPR